MKKKAADLQVKAILKGIDNSEVRRDLMARNLTIDELKEAVQQYKWLKKQGQEVFDVI